MDNENQPGSTPQPEPIPNERPATWDLVIADMRARDEKGRTDYGTPLQPFNGRNSLVDLYQELLDAVVYTKNEIEESSEAHAELERLRAENEALKQRAEERAAMQSEITSRDLALVLKDSAIEDLRERIAELTSAMENQSECLRDTVRMLTPHGGGRSQQFTEADALVSRIKAALAKARGGK